MFLRNLFLPEYMVKPSMRLGEIPSFKQAYKTSLSMAWPSAIEALLVALISSFDIMMVGGLGSSAIAAVGICTQPRFILLAVVLTLNMGVTAVVARRKGQNDIQGAVSALKQALAISFVLSIIITIIGEVFARELLILAGANSDYINEAVTYFRIILIGNFFSCLSLTMTAAQRGFGNTRISMITNTTANLVNILFNWLLINGIWIFPRLEVMGAAIATSIGNFVAFLIAVRSITRRDVPLAIRDLKIKFDKYTINSIGKVWGGGFVEQIFIRLGFFLYAKMVASLGTTEFATHQICMHIINISFALGDGFSVASTSLVGQNLGAKRSDLAIMYAKVGQRMAMVMGILLSILFVFLRVPLLRLFSNDVDVITLGAKIMFILALVCQIQPSQVVISGCLRGAGDSGYVALTSFLSIGLIRPALSYFLCYTIGWGLFGAWIGLYFDQLSRLILNIIRFRSCKWTAIRL
ncbi:MAG: MATE family efflux transporter [Clostridiales bacterium]|nr:MATE family efflux transporter [Clostridiales bacterium]